MEKLSFISKEVYMGGYIAVGVICLFAGSIIGCVVMCLMVSCKNNDEYHVEGLDLDKERGESGDR